MKGTWYNSARLSYYGGYQRHRPDSSIQSRLNLPFLKGLIEHHTAALYRNPSLHCSKGLYSLSLPRLPCKLFQIPYTNESFLVDFFAALPWQYLTAIRLFAKTGSFFSPFGKVQIMLLIAGPVLAVGLDSKRRQHYDS